AGTGARGGPAALRVLLQLGVFARAQRRARVLHVVAEYPPVARHGRDEAIARILLGRILPAGDPDRPDVEHRVADRYQLHGAALDRRSALPEQRELTADELVGLDRARRLRARWRRRVRHSQQP